MWAGVAQTSTMDLSSTLSAFGSRILHRHHPGDQLATTLATASPLLRLMRNLDIRSNEAVALWDQIDSLDEVGRARGA